MNLTKRLFHFGQQTMAVSGGSNQQPYPLLYLTKLKVQGSSRALAVQGEQGILGFSNPSYPTNPTKFYV